MNKSTLKRSTFRKPEMKSTSIKPMIKCKNKACRTPFAPARPFITWCSDDCGAVLGLEKVAKKKAKEARAERAEIKKKLLEHKPLAYWEKIAERLCNEYIRSRDPDICISCGVTQSSAFQAGHYISVGANKTLRYNEFNIHKQCIKCNLFEGSNAIQYRINLVKKIGIEKVEWLESWHSPIKMTAALAQEIAEYFKQKLRELKNGR